MGKQTSSYRGIVEAVFEEKVGRDLEGFVLRSKAAGSSWRAIALEVRDATDGAVEVSNQTLMNWYGDKPREGAA